MKNITTRAALLLVAFAFPTLAPAGGLGEFLARGGPAAPDQSQSASAIGDPLSGDCAVSQDILADEEVPDYFTGSTAMAARDARLNWAESGTPVEEQATLRPAARNTLAARY